MDFILNTFLRILHFACIYSFGMKLQLCSGIQDALFIQQMTTPPDVTCKPQARMSFSRVFGGSSDYNLKTQGIIQISFIYNFVKGIYHQSNQALK